MTSNTTYPSMTNTNLHDGVVGEPDSPQWLEIANTLPSMRGARVLILNCGSGWLCRFAAASGALNIVGVSDDAAALAKARAEADSARMRYRVLPEEFWPMLGGQFDMIIVAGVQPESTANLSNISHLFRHGHGILAISGQAHVLEELSKTIHTADNRPGSWHATSGERISNGDLLIVMTRSRIANPS